MHMYMNEHIFVCIYTSTYFLVVKAATVVWIGKPVEIGDSFIHVYTYLYVYMFIYI
jgi:hypothetical protein